MASSSSLSSSSNCWTKAFSTKLRSRFCDLVSLLSFSVVREIKAQEDQIQHTIDPICNHDGRREKYCSDPKHQWMALLSREYCCLEASDLKGCFWNSLFIRNYDPVFGDESIQIGIRTGLECQHVCLSAPKCKTWTYVHALEGPASGLRGGCWLKSQTLEDIIDAARERAKTGDRDMDIAQVPGTVSGRRCACKTCEPKTIEPHLILKTDDMPFSTSMAKNGFYILRNAISPELADRVHWKCQNITQQMIAKDPYNLGNRGARRYSLGSAQITHHLVHEDEWIEMLNTEKIHDLVDSLGHFMIVGGGGDLVMGETDTHQWLHSDLPREEMYNRVTAPALAVNFAVHDVPCEMGSLRLYPGTHRNSFEYVGVGEEREKLNDMVKFVCPLNKGDAVIRDLRVWHAGSANQSPTPRYFPNIEFLAQWFADVTKDFGDHLSPRKILPKAQFNKLIPKAQRKAIQIIAPDDLQVGMLKDIVIPQPSG